MKAVTHVTSINSVKQAKGRNLWRSALGRSSLMEYQKTAFTLIHFTDMATFAVYIFQVFTAAAFSLHFFIRFHKYPLW